MTANLTRRALLATALSSVATVAFANAPDVSLRPKQRPDWDPATSPFIRVPADGIVADAKLNGVTGYIVKDMRTGRTLEAGASGTALPPASVSKAVTSLFALDTLGPAHRFRTRLLATGPLVNGILQGDLILAGGGDPNLVTDELGALVDNFIASGITQITGKFQVWGEALEYREEIDPPQLDHLGYNPSISGLNLNFNRVHFEWKRAGTNYTVSMDARSATRRPEVYTSRMRVVDRAVPVFTYAKSGAIDDWTVARRALGRGGARWLPVRNPALYAADVFQTLARAGGVALPNPEKIAALPSGSQLAVFEGAPLTAVLQDMLRFSTNITAEGVGLTATRAIDSAARGIGNSAAAMTRWTQSRAGGDAAFMDHSGLSDRSKISAGDMTTLLMSEGANAALWPILKKIRLTDEDGNDLADFPAEVRAKTGTLNFVSTLAGYIRTAEGHDLAFTIFSADLAARAAGKASGDEQPAGSLSWNRRAKRMQQRLLQRWAIAYPENS